jgi:hypothetical protein
VSSTKKKKKKKTTSKTMTEYKVTDLPQPKEEQVKVKSDNRSLRSNIDGNNNSSSSRRRKSTGKSDTDGNNHSSSSHRRKSTGKSDTDGNNHSSSSRRKSTGISATKSSLTTTNGHNSNISSNNKSDTDRSLRPNITDGNNNSSPHRRSSANSSVTKSSSTATTTTNGGNNRNSHSKKKSTKKLAAKAVAMTSTDTGFKNGGGIERPKDDDDVLMNNDEDEDEDEEVGHHMETVNLAGNNKDGVVMEKTKRNKKMWWLIIMLVVLVIVALAVILPCYFLIIAPSSSSRGSDIGKNYPKISSESPDTVIGDMPMDICSELFPGERDCTSVGSDDVRQGGRLCNLVAKSMINTTMSVDIALINSGVCRKSLLRPELKIGDVQYAVAANELVVVEMSGDDLVNILTEAVSSSFNGGPSSSPESYPYAAGLRYNVEANLMPSERISNIETNVGLRYDDRWEPIATRRFYKVVTTAQLAEGLMGYYSFGNVINDWKTPLNIETTDTFYNYVKNNEEDWWSLPDNEYSTQYFIAEDEEPTLAMVPKRICHALIPGKPESSFCKAGDVIHGGEVCSLVAWGLYDQSFGVDVVLLKGDTCTGDIDDGKFGQSDIDSALLFDQSLVTIDLTGGVVKSMIEEGISAVLENGTNGAYPYFAGLRFDVNTNSVPGERANNVEIRTSSGSWIPITDTDSYRMITTSDIATGEDPSYSTISQAGDMPTMQNTLKDEFTTYAIEWGELHALSEDKMSTQSYV